MDGDVGARVTRTIARMMAMVAVATIALVGCAGDEPLQPTLTSVNFTPKLVIEITGHQLTFTKGPLADDRVSTDNPTVPAGTVIEVVNRGPASHRLQGDIVFDTGIMRSGERTTIVLTNDTATVKQISITDPTDPEIRGSVSVTPKSETTNDANP